jgi:hypothetical protein
VTGLTLHLLLAIAGAHPAQPCESLARLHLDGVIIIAAESIGAGAFKVPSLRRNTPPEFFTAFDKLQAFCRVRAISRPTSDSQIRLEVWLPSAWNGRYLGVGNGGYGGSISYFRLGEGVNAGFAVSATDTGHRGAATDASWAIGHPEKQTDFDYRAIHETARVARVAISALYGTPPARSYFNSCSNGGRQGLMEAERYPDDYDGIFAGAPALRWGFGTFVSGDLERFAARGGKIIIYHGGADAPQRTITFVDRLRRTLGEDRVRQFLQLYVVPGMGHCGSGTGPNDIGQWLRPGRDRQHSLFESLIAWVEKGEAPTGVIATRFVRDGDASSGVERTSVLCPYVDGDASAACTP